MSITSLPANQSAHCSVSQTVMDFLTLAVSLGGIHGVPRWTLAEKASWRVGTAKHTAGHTHGKQTFVHIWRGKEWMTG